MHGLRYKTSGPAGGGDGDKLCQADLLFVWVNIGAPVRTVSRLRPKTFKISLAEATVF